MTLDDIRAALPSGNWQHNRLYEDVGLAAELRMQPSHFWLLDESDQAYLLAHKRASRTMEAFEQHLQSKEAKKK